MRKKALIIILFAATFIVCTVVLYLSRDQTGDLNKAYGTVDIRQSSLAFEIQGRIKTLNADTGDIVDKGDILAVLDTQSLEYQKAIQKAQCSALKASLSELASGYRKEEIAQAKAEVNSLENSLGIAKITYDRYQRLFKTNSISAQDRDSAFYNMREIASNLDKARANYSLLQKGYRQEQIDNAEANYEACTANLDYLDYQINSQSVLKAPFSGQIRVRLKELGDMAGPSSPVMEISCVYQKRVLCYLTEKQLKDLKIGAKAVISNANGEQITGTLSYISNTAMFTPKTVQTEDLRAELVYEARIETYDKDAILRLGQSVSVEFQK